MAAEGRVLVDNDPRGAAFLIAPGVAVTARHVITPALDENDQHRPGRVMTWTSAVA